VLSILNKFPTALQYYIKAYDELKKNEYDDAITDCVQAFESVVKSRLKQAGLIGSSDEHKPFKFHLDLFKKQVDVPTYMLEHLDTLFKLFEGITKPRNKDASHGKPEASVVQPINEVFVRYVIPYLDL